MQVARIVSFLQTPKAFIAFIVISFFVFFLLSSTLLDPDFGWHIRMGEIILARGIAQTDPFSYTMPSYPYVDHEWATNVLFFLIYESIGWQGMAVVFSLLGCVVFLIAVPKKYYSYALFPTAATAALFLPRFGIRPQVISWLFFAIVFRVLFDQMLWKKFRLLLPALFLVWVNMHGSFALGFVMVGLKLFIEAVSEKRIFPIALGGVVIFATCVTPYGYRMWWEVFQQISDIHLHSRITEWQPFWVRPELALGALAVSVIIFVTRYNKHVLIFHLLILFGTGILALSALRHVPIFALACLTVLPAFLQALFHEAKKYTQGEKRAGVFIAFLGVIGFLLFTLDAGLSYSGVSNITESTFYPKQAVAFLKSDHTDKNIFSLYGWGGYLIWKLPDKKVFIDGRMPSFRWNAPEGESGNAMEEYLTIGEGKNRKELFEKYDVSFILWPKRDGSAGVLETLLKRFGVQPETPLDFTDQLKQEGWVRIYEDDVAVIFEKKS